MFCFPFPVQVFLVSSKEKRPGASPAFFPLVRQEYIIIMGS
jgi:hypothetical protein